MSELNKPWEIPSSELSLRLTELVQTSKYDSDVVEIDKDLVTQAAARIAAYGAMENKLKDLRELVPQFNKLHEELLVSVREFAGDKFEELLGELSGSIKDINITTGVKQ